MTRLTSWPKSRLRTEDGLSHIGKAILALEFNWSSPLVVDEPRPRPPIVLPILNELTALWAAEVRSLRLRLLSGELPRRFKTFVKSEAGAAAAIKLPLSAKLPNGRETFDPIDRLLMSLTRFVTVVIKSATDPKPVASPRSDSSVSREKLPRPGS